jgi:hypothetical protein
MVEKARAKTAANKAASLQPSSKTTEPKKKKRKLDPTSQSVDGDSSHSKTGVKDEVLDRSKKSNTQKHNKVKPRYFEESRGSGRAKKGDRPKGKKIKPEKGRKEKKRRGHDGGDVLKIID